MANQQLENVIERPASTTSGFTMLFIGIAVEALAVWKFIDAIRFEHIPTMILSFVIFTAGLLVLVGLFTVQPNESRVLVFFGRYIGSCRLEGFRWGNPFAIKKRVSLRVRNLTSETIKVNDESGSPIEIASVVVWRVIDTAKALFDVDHYEQFVNIQVETAVRSLATGHPYDPRDAEGNEISLRGNQEEIADELGSGCRNGCRLRVSTSWRPGSLISPTHRRSHKRCSGGNRRRQWWQPDGSSSRPPWEWWTTLCGSFPIRASCNWTRSARLRWSTTSWSC